MSNRVLYRKYRSRNLDEILGQDHIRDSFKASLKSKKIAHAYLFVGPRGTGKTSVARIVAFQINDKPYSDDGNIDIIEIDAASNRRIDEIRELRDKIHISPLESTYKVYIIDEVHMLTREAFNALLKTLEEPPAHAIFILATTEGHKVPETIISRTQQFLFKPIAVDIIAKHLKNIAAKEKIKVDKAALLRIAEYGHGSFRDSIGLLDQLSTHSKKIDESTVQDFLGHGSDKELDKILEHMRLGRRKDLSTSLDNLLVNGAQPRAIAEQLISRILSGDICSKDLELVESLLGVSQSTMPHISLEIELQKFALSVTPVTNTMITPTKKTIAKINKSEKEVGNNTPRLNESFKAIEKKRWASILNAIKAKNNALYAILRMAKVETAGSTMKLVFPFKFHASRFDDKKMINSFRDTANTVIDEVGQVVIDVDPAVTPTSGEIAESELVATAPKIDSADKLQKVVDTFGGGEVIKL